MVNRVNSSPPPPPSSPTQATQAQATQQAQNVQASQSSASVQSAPLVLTKQNTSDVTRQGISAQVRIASRPKKEIAEKIKREMPDGIKDETIRVEEIFLAAIGQEPEGSNTKNEVTEILQQYDEDIERFIQDELTGFNPTEQLSILYSLQEKVDIGKNPLLQKSLANKIETMYQGSPEIQLGFATADINVEGTPFSDPVKAKNSFAPYMLTANNHSAFLASLIGTMPEETAQAELPALLSFQMRLLSAETNIFQTTQKPEAEGLRTVTSNIKYLQQITSLFGNITKVLDETSRNVKGMEENILPTATTVVQSILKAKESDTITKASIQLAFPYLTANPKESAIMSTLCNRILSSIQEATSTYAFASAEKKDELAKALKEVSQDLEANVHGS